jgi:transposase
LVLAWPQLWEQYVDTQADYRAPLETLARKMVEAGTDARQLLDWLASPPAQQWALGKQTALLARVFSEQFEVLPGAGALQPKTKEQISSARVQNPHDPDATYAAKGKGEQKKEHVGYKVQVAETVSEAVLAPGEPTRNFLSGILTHAARESDEEGSQKMEREQQATGKVSYRFEWDTATCAACSLRQQCIQTDHPHRALVAGEHHSTLQARRQEQQTKPFQQRMRHRNAIEGTQSELVRAHGLRHARYRGLPKARPQNYFIAAACNIKRWLRRAAWELQNTLTVALSPAPAHGSSGAG